MKTLDQILNESQDTDLKLLKTFLKSVGFTQAESSTKTYKTSAANVLELYGIAMRAGKWADIYVAVTDDAKPYWIIDSEGRDMYLSVNDAIKALQKRMHTIKEGEDTEEVDSIGETLSLLDEISEMTEELYDALADQDSLDESIISEVQSIYSHVDDFYNNVDEKYGIESDDDEYDFSDMKEEFETVTEEIDYTKFKRLASVGLVDSAEISKLVLAMKALESGKAISTTQKDIISSTFLSLVAIVTGDSTLLSKISQELK
jgi:hypothetical protein